MALCSDGGSGFHTEREVSLIFLLGGILGHSHPPELLFFVLFSPTTWLKETKSIGARMPQWPPFSRKQRMRHTCFRHGASIYPCRAGGSLGTLKILGTGAKFFLGLVRLHVDNWECRAQNCRHGAKKLPCRAIFFKRVNGVCFVVHPNDEQKQTTEQISVNNRTPEHAFISSIYKKLQMYDKDIVKYLQKKGKDQLTFQAYSKYFCSKSFLTSCFEWKVESAGFSFKLFHCVSRTFEELATNFLASPRSELQKLHVTISPPALVTFWSRAFSGCWSCSGHGIHLMRMYPDRDTFKFMQGHVDTNQPMRIVFRAKTADVCIM